RSKRDWSSDVCSSDLVKQLGLKKTEETKKISKPYLIQMNETAQEIYVNKLQKSKEAIQYTKERNLSEETIKKFGIGFSDKDKTRSEERRVGKERSDES